LHNSIRAVRVAVLLLAFVTATPVARASSVVARLVWTAPGDNGDVGTAFSYDIRRSTTPLTLLNFAFADTVGSVPKPAPAGTTQSCDVVLPDAATTYYFGIRTSDRAGNRSWISNVVSISGARAAVMRTRVPGAADFAMPWPNPARSFTTFQLQAPEPARSSVEVFDAAGRHIRSVFQGELPPGTRQIQWDLHDDEGRTAPGGVYFIRVQIGDYARTRQLVVVR
jgi:hypothetical protein